MGFSIQMNTPLKQCKFLEHPEDKCDLFFYSYIVWYGNNELKINISYAYDSFI